MEHSVRILCKNNKKIKDIKIGSSLSEVFTEFGLKMDYGPISAKVNNKVEDLHYRVYHDKEVEFLDIRSSSGQRAYTRTLFFVLSKAVHELYPNGKVIIDTPVSNGYYCNLEISCALTQEKVQEIRSKMEEIIKREIPILMVECPTIEAEKMFLEMQEYSKAKLLNSIGSLYTTYHEIDGYKDYYYGALLRNTRELYLFGLEKYYDGLLLRTPSKQDPSKLNEIIRQDKMFEIFQEHHAWQKILGVLTVGDLNEAVKNGHSTQLINVSEALQEKKISQIAEMIAQRKGTKMVLVSGPSSSGKTTFCKRLSIQLLTCGIKPVPISLDDYFVDREKTPKDSLGEYDYESLYALNIPLLNSQLRDMFNGKEVELPHYNFQAGKSESSGVKMKLQDDNILILEGIHALNPELTSQIPEEKKFRVYTSALTTILLDTHNYIPTTDNRLLRRIIRDFKYRGTSACDTIKRWASVRSGEQKWIFPFQENADVMFNTAMLFELASIKEQALTLLEQVPQNKEEYAEAYRLRKFLKYIFAIPNKQIPPTSLLREFLGGSSFKY